jgi:flap endonuclease-1
VRKGADKLAKFLNSKQQGRLDGFFIVQAKTSPKKGASKDSGKDAKGKGKGKADAKGSKRKVCGILILPSFGLSVMQD